jgi:hypothetical protein
MSKRLSLILSEDDRQRLEPFIRAGTGHHQVLQRWAAEQGIASVTSEAAVLRVLLRAGVQAMRDDVLDEGYAELAEFYQGTEERAERRTALDRYVKQTEAAL